MRYWLVGLLAASVTINVLFAHRLFEMQKTLNALWAEGEHYLRVNHNRPNEPAYTQAPPLEADVQRVAAPTYGNPSETNERRQKTPINQDDDQATRLDYLQNLRGQERYDELIYALHEFLRDYPQSIEGIMLEAEAIYYTQPLNVAIMHYYNLRERELPTEMQQEVEKFIELHSSRTIQQLSGGGSWTLLAAFLEPLIQLDPTNRNYILALAKAYGMDAHFSLMEDALAALPSNDVRAQELRDSIYARNSDPQLDEQIAAVSDVSDQQLGVKPSQLVRLIKHDNKLTAGVMVDDHRLRLLVDTGASMTALKLSMRDKIQDNAEFLGLFRVQTAGGMITSPIYRLQEFQLGKSMLNDVSVMLIDDSNLGDNDGLLGMNVLSKFDFIQTDSTGHVYIQKKLTPP